MKYLKIQTWIPFSQIVRVKSRVLRIINILYNLKTFILYRGVGWGKPRSKPSLKILSVGLVLIITRSVIPSSFRARNKTVLAGTILFKSNINSNISLKIQNKYIATRWLPASSGWLICKDRMYCLYCVCLKPAI